MSPTLGHPFFVWLEVRFAHDALLAAAWPGTTAAAAANKANSAADAASLLELLTLMAQSWLSEWCLEASSLAVQVHGGCGDTRDFPVEQLWHDNRLNMIHEGTHRIQAKDLLGGKVLAEGGLAFSLRQDRVHQTTAQARPLPDRALWADALEDAVAMVRSVTQAAWRDGRPDWAMQKAMGYLRAFGHAVLA